MSKRLLGNVPIFAKDSAFGSLHDTTGKAFRSGSLGFYRNNMVGYEKGTLPKRRLDIAASVTWFRVSIYNNIC